MIVRLLGPQDAEDYRKVRLEALRQHPDAFAVSYEEEEVRPVSIYEERFQSNENYTFGAFDGDELIGTVTLLKERYRKLKHRANIVAMYVQSPHRSKGVGKKLMTAAIKQAKSEPDIEQVYLTVVQSNASAKKLYQSLGFTTFGIDSKALKIGQDYLDEELMVLAII
ncbi:GNAT family N-acetyltransferase [Bacillus carboniphilus]|uniref:GNAT family N-acetyltransferase n=1 Tax=Bacillus carboniphilus TaxID=86663 RepID=A0ABN0WNT0_9BACI